MQQAPDIKSYSLAEFFVSTYQVPSYQRNFTWGEDQVTELIEDLVEFNKSSDPFYLLGDIIVAPSGNEHFKYELIDGQQRSTSMMIIFSVAYRKLDGWGYGIDDLNQLYNAIKLSGTSLKVKMSGDASSVVLSYLADGDIQALSKDTPSKINVVGAIDVVAKLLDAEFSEGNKDALLSFVKKILSSVYVGRLTLQTVDQATEFFERVNSRGVGLTAADLLKNRLLQKIEGDADYDAASQSWSNAEKLLMSKGKQGSLEFLLRQLRQADLGVKVQEKDLFKETKSVVKDEAGCLILIERIESKYKPLNNILLGRTPNGLPDSIADGSRFFKFTQNYGVKLAGSHLSDESFGYLSERLEGRAILSLLANERSQAYEKNVPVWAKNVQELSEDCSRIEIAEVLNFDENELDQLHAVAHQFFTGLRYDGTPGQIKRIRYILAKVNHVLNTQGPVENISLADFLVTSKTTKKKVFPGFDIDHVNAQANPDFESSHQLIGNLTLLHTFDNQAEGANPPPEKVVSYGHSKCYATRALTKNFDQPPQIENVIAPYRVAVIDGIDPWGLDHMQARASMYWSVVTRSLSGDLSFSFNPELNG